jgi:transposase-like protein
MEPGMNVSHVTRLHGIQPSLLSKWKKQYQEGSLTPLRPERKSFQLQSLLLL